MSELELVDINEEGKEEERGQENREEKDQEETSFTENTKDNYDNTRSRINTETPTQDDTDLNDFNLTDAARSIAKNQQDGKTRNEGAIQILRMITDENLGDYGDSSEELINNISEAKINEKGKLTALKFKGKDPDVKLTAKGKISKSATVQNREILKAIENAKAEYKASLNAVVDESAGSPMSDEASGSVQENVIERMENQVQELSDEIEEKDLDGNIKREIYRVSDADKTIDYDNLENHYQKMQYDYKIDNLKENIKKWENLRDNEQDPTRKKLFETARKLYVIKKSEMEVKANQRPESEEALSMIQEETERNYLTRFGRFKKWAKENITGVSAVAISVAGVVTAAVMAGRNAIKTGAKAVGQFGKALANLAKKAGPAIAAILNFVAQAITWGAKALEFLSRNLWIVALFLTYLLYDTVKERAKQR